MKKRVFTSVLGLSFLVTGVASAQLPNEDLMCRPDEPRMDKFAYLRAISLDLRGDVPTVEEYRSLDAGTDVSDALIETWLASEAFVDRSVRAHQALMWNNINNVRIVNYQSNMTRTRMSGDWVYWRNRVAQVYRGLDRPPCRDVPATWDNEGNIEFIVDGDGMRREGWVELEPYWAPGTTIKVCAFDAQDNLTSSSGTQCETNAGYNDANCG